MPDIDVITPVYGQPDLTIDCVRHLAAEGSDLHWLWVDNGSPDDDVHRIELATQKYGLPTTRIRFAENLGFVVATNAGLRESTAPYVLLLNNDTRVFPGTIARLRRVLDERPNAGIAGPVSSSGWQGWPNLVSKIREFALLNREGAFKGSDEEIAERLGSRFGDHVRPLDPTKGMLAFFCALIRREVIEKVGFLDERYGVGFGDDDDYCEAARRAGFTLYFAMGAYCWHKHRTTFRELYSEQEIQVRQSEAMVVLGEKWG